jgi:outer membrane protein OmpA-like peptidoglycan-associated protein
MSKTYARPLAMAALTMALAVGAAGCQTMSDLDPTGLLGGDEAPAETQFPTDSQEQAAADAATTTPDLASIPARPPAPNTAAQADTAQQVASAGAQAQYSAEALRAGTDAAAPPPTAADAAAARQALASADAPPSAQAPSADAPPTTDAPPSAQGPSADAPPTAGSDLPPTAAAPTANASAASAPGAAAPSGNPAVPPRTRVASAAPPPPAAEPPSAAASSAAPSAEPPTAAPGAQAPTSQAPVASVPLAPPPGAQPSGTQPAVPAVPATAGGRLAMVNPTDAQLGFKPSAAPALAPGVSNWVSPPVLAHYRQTAAQAGAAGVGPAAVPAVAARGETVASAGDVRANLGAVPGTPAGMAAAMNGGMPPAAIVYFPGDGTSLSKTALTEVRQAAQAFKATGGTGSIKVVGHASSRTANMSVERHLELIFQKSQARANAVAQALIKAGVPAAKVQIEAVGDSQPIYYESMPKGEDGNRRAEIFLQG